MKKWPALIPYSLNPQRRTFHDVDGRIHRPLPRRHRRHDRPLAEIVAEALAAASKKHHPHASHQDSLGSAKIFSAASAFLTAIHAHRHRRQSLLHSNRPRNHAAFEILVFHYCYHAPLMKPSHHSTTASSARARQYRPPVNPAKPLASSNSTISTRSKMPSSTMMSPAFSPKPAMTNVASFFPTMAY